MHIYFSGIGAGTGPLALLALKAGYDVSCSDKQNHEYIDYLKKRGVKNIHVGQTKEKIESININNPIDWLVYSSAVAIENPNHPEIIFAKENNIKTTKRDELLNKIIKDTGQKLIAIAGTHGKTTTTAMMIWLFKQLGVPVSYSLGAKLSFGDMSDFDTKSEYFVYEADEYDRNFLEFSPDIAIIPGIDYDHPDIYPTREEYYQAFIDFLNQSEDIYAHKVDMEKIGLDARKLSAKEDDFTLPGRVNRNNAQLVVQAMHDTSNVPIPRLIEIMNNFPGVSRRFERITDGVYSDYAHTPEKIKGALQMAREVAGDKFIVVYEGLHNNRQNFIKKELENLFEDSSKLIIVPSYLAREDKELEMLTPEKLANITKKPEIREAAYLNKDLKSSIIKSVSEGNIVLCLTAGGGGSLDEWLRAEFR